MADPLEALAAQLLGEDTQAKIKAENPYFNLAGAPDAIDSLALKTGAANPKTSMKEALAWSLGSGLLSGLLQGEGAEHQNTLTERVVNAANQRAAGVPITEDSTDLSPNLFSLAGRQGNLFQTQRALEQQDLAQKSSLQQRKDVFDALSKATSQEEQDRIITAAKALGIVAKDFKTSSADTTDKITTSQTDSSDGGPKLPGKSLSDVEMEAFRKNLLAGMPRTQASTSAKATAEDIRARNKALLTVPAAAENDAIGNAERIITEGTEGMAKAGVTGSAWGSMYEKYRSLLGDLVLPLKSEEADTQAAGDKQLEQTKNLGAALNRIKGSGSLSDMESRALFATALSPTNTNTQNEAIMRNYQNGLKVMKEHQGFMNYMVAEGRSPELAQTLWNIYREQNPIIAQDQNGDYKIQEDRTPWQKYDFTSAYQKYLAGDLPSVDVTQAKSKETNSIPSIGSSFKGGKVVSVKQIK